MSRRCRKPVWVLLMQSPFSLHVDLYSCSCIWFLPGFSWPRVAAQSQINKDLCWQLLQNLLACFRAFFFPLCTGCWMQRPRISSGGRFPGQAQRVSGFCFPLQINCYKDSFLFTVELWLLKDWKGNASCCALPCRRAVSSSLLECDLKVALKMCFKVCSLCSSHHDSIY